MNAHRNFEEKPNSWKDASIQISGSILQPRTSTASRTRLKENINKMKNRVKLLSNFHVKPVLSEINTKMDKTMITIKNQQARDVIFTILRLPQKNRKPEHEKFVRKALKFEAAFRELKKRAPKRVFNQLFCELRHEYIMSGRPIYKSSEAIQKFYVVLEGEVYNLIEKSRLLNSDEDNETQGNDEFIREFYPEMEVLNVFGPGDSFGGFSAISDDRE